MGRVTELCDGILRTFWRQSPVSASFLGIHDYDHLLPSFDPDALREKTRQLKDHLRDVETLRRSEPALSDDEDLDLDVVERELRTQIRVEEETRLPFRNPGLYLEEITFGLYILLQREFAPLEERVRSARDRLLAVPRVLEEARRNLSDPSEVPPVWVSMGSDLAASTVEFMGEMTSRVSEGAPALLPEYQKATAQAAQAVSGYARHLNERISGRARGKYAAGEAMLDFLLQVPHGLPYSASELEDFGRSEIERTLRRLEEAAREDGTGKSWVERVDSFGDDLPEPGRMVSAYEAALQRARQFVRERDLVTIPPAEILRVVETPVFERKTTPFAAYIPPAPFEERQEGYFWVTPPEASLSSAERSARMRGHVLPGIPVTTVHEGYPGHHLQISLANRVRSSVRRQVWTPVMVEGWALYCEEMMGEQGFYADPRTRLLQLKDHLWRACRVVIDVGLHTEKLSFEEAVRMLVEVARLEPAGATGEVKRYTKTPTQPLSYAVGQREIRALRDEVRAAEGGRFSLGRFHDRLLQYGSIPISLIRARLLPSPQA